MIEDNRRGEKTRAGNRNPSNDEIVCDEEEKEGTRRRRGRTRRRMTSCFQSRNRKSKPWRICSCCFSEEKEVDDIVRDVQQQQQQPAAAGNGFTRSEEFAPVEHPLEPPDIDKPARCPVPEPCIVHDGIIWKERVAIARRRLDVAKDKDEFTAGRRRSL